MARDAMDIKEALAAKIMRPRAVQRTHVDVTVCEKDSPGNAAVTGQLDAKKEEK